MPLLADSLRNLSATLIVMALVIAALVLGSSILIPLAIAIVIAFVLAPVVKWLTMRHVPQPVAAIGVLFVAIILIGALSFAVSAQLLSLTADLGNYKQNLVDKVRSIAEMGRSDGLISRSITAVETLGTDIARELGRGMGGQGDPLVVAQQQQGTTAEILKGIGAVLEPLAQSGITILFAALLLLQHHDLRDRIIKIAGTDRLSGTAAAISAAGSKLSDLFLALAMMNGGYGIAIGVSLWLIGVPNPLLWGIMAGMLRFVPFIGPLLAAIPPIVLAAAVDPGWTTVILTVAVIIIGEAIFNNIVEPFVLGRKAGITAFGMVVAASFWTVVWGPIGLLLSAPLTTTIVVFGNHIRGLEFLSVLFGDEDPLDPAQELYHRLLAGDPMAAATTLENEIGEMAPVQASDKIILPALRLAALDQRAQRLEPEQADRLRETMQEASDLFFETPKESKEIEAGSVEPPTVCIIPGRGVVDRAAADHIARLVSQHTPCRGVVAARSTGLTAIADLHAMDEYKNVDTIIVATVGGVDDKQLRLIARRAARTFPDANQFVLAPPRSTPQLSPTESDGEADTWRTHTTLEPIIAALDCAPRRSSKAATEPAASGETPRVPEAIA